MSEAATLTGGLDHSLDGEAYPVASNDTTAGRQQNRRVDIVFSNASGQFSEAALSRRTAIRR